MRGIGGQGGQPDAELQSGTGPLIRPTRDVARDKAAVGRSAIMSTLRLLCLDAGASGTKRTKSAYLLRFVELVRIHPGPSGPPVGEFGNSDQII